MRRVVIFAVVAVVVVVGAAGYLVSVSRGQPDAAGASPSASQAVQIGGGEPYIAFRRTGVDQWYGTVAAVPRDEPATAPSPTDLACERVHMSANGGICLKVDPTIASNSQVQLLGPDMAVQHRLSTPGIPSRARVSADGRLASTTTFVYGHSYAATDLSTQTEIFDMASGTSLGNLEDWTITYRGQRVEAADLNIWGVTFAPDSNRFYATARTGGAIHLAEGDVPGRTLVMLEAAAECPSLSPSGELLAYKHATAPGVWQVRVRTLADGSEVVVGEQRSVDDQVEWLGDGQIVYGLARTDGSTVTDVWVAEADGSGTSQKLIEAAWSPAVVPGSAS